MDTLKPVWDILVYVVLPLWVLAGFGDYLCHRATDIEHANGAKESALHWLMLFETGAPILAAVFLKVNAVVLGFAFVCLIVHEITGHIDLQLAMATRRVTALEQQIHSLLEVLPLMALLLLAILHYRQAQALFGFGTQAADFSIVLKPLPDWPVIGPPAVAFLIFAILPYAEEFIRGLRAEKASASQGTDGSIG
ncbi:MAG TPA: hypothetical protein VHL34_16430 [Rhizomicrobium sp.]|jgi:hypothetical protein|nr:hypothetical protein [Rhizomicrobium sp.]